MITPEPITLENESGRVFEVELGRYEDIKVPKVSNDTSQKTIQKSETAAEGDQSQEVETERKWITYKLDQTKAE